MQRVTARRDREHHDRENSVCDADDDPGAPPCSVHGIERMAVDDAERAADAQVRHQSHAVARQLLGEQPAEVALRPDDESHDRRPEHPCPERPHARVGRGLVAHRLQPAARRDARNRRASFRRPGASCRRPRIRAFGPVRRSLLAVSVRPPASDVDVMPHIDGVLRSFADFLRHAAPVVGPLSAEADDPGYWNDWAQANWEALVEAMLPRELTARLRVYGDGAVCNGHRSRILAPRLSETHVIVCRPRGDLRLRDLLGDTAVLPATSMPIFDRFVTIDRDRAVEAPPFDCVRVRTLQPPVAVLPIDAVSFHLCSNRVLRRTAWASVIQSP
jgi:hypothetical protein